METMEEATQIFREIACQERELGPEMVREGAGGYCGRVP